MTRTVSYSSCARLFSILYHNFERLSCLFTRLLADQLECYETHIANVLAFFLASYLQNVEICSAAFTRTVSTAFSRVPTIIVGLPSSLIFDLKLLVTTKLLLLLKGIDFLKTSLPTMSMFYNLVSLLQKEVTSQRLAYLNRVNN